VLLLLAGLTGAITGLLVAGFERLTADVLLHGVRSLPLAARAACPAVGVAGSVLFLTYLGRGASAATADEYIRAFHDRDDHFDLRLVPARMLAAIATLGAGGPLGYEGPSIYAGAGVGTAVQRRLGYWFGPEHGKVLLVAGAAAGVAAIFKAPVTGLVFALEVPYQEDLAHRMLLPAAISAATSWSPQITAIDRPARSSSFSASSDSSGAENRMPATRFLASTPTRSSPIPRRSIG